MSALLFLGLAAVLCAIGCGILWLRSRQPRSMDAHIREFARELEALAPDSGPSRPPGVAPRPPEGGDPPARGRPEERPRSG